MTKDENIAYMSELYSRCQVRGKHDARSNSKPHASKQLSQAGPPDPALVRKRHPSPFMVTAPPSPNPHTQETREKTKAELASKYLQPLVRPAAAARPAPGKKAHKPTAAAAADGGAA